MNTPITFGDVPWTWHEGYKARTDSLGLILCECSAHVYERQRRALAWHVWLRP